MCTNKVSNTEVRIWAMLDNRSQGNFVKKTLRKELKVEGKSITVIVKTLNEDCKHSSLAVNDFEVGSIEEKQADLVALPRIFSQSDLPVASDETSTLENIQQGKYFHRIIPEMKMDRNLDVNLLIGANCLKA